MRYKTTTALAIVLLAASEAGVSARPAIATFNANLRSGPGIENPVVAIIPDQAPIDVGSCRGSWCRVSWNGQDGYLSTSLIASVSSRRRMAAEQPVAEAPVASVDRPLATSPAAGYAYGGGYGPDYGDNGYDAGYAYGGGYDPYYAYDNYDDDYGYGYDNYGVNGGLYLGGGNGRRYGAGRYGGGAAYAPGGRPAYGGRPVVNANAPGNRGGAGLGGAHIGAGRIGAGRVGERR